MDCDRLLRRKNRGARKRATHLHQPGTSGDGLDLEAVDVALATDGDLRGRDLRGKAVFFYSADYTSRQAPVSDYAIKRIGDRGAAAIFVIVGLPGNLRTQFYPVGSTVPTFSLGLEDGVAIRNLISQSRDGRPARVRIRLDVKTIPDLKTATVWGSLAGTSDESIFVVAHRDGWFEGATDNASGVATLLGLAEYFAKIPTEQRRRTIYFLGTSGHHDNRGMTGHWLADHKEMFTKTALIINCEHTSAEQLVYRGGLIRRTNTTVPLRWYVGGSPRLEQIVVKAYDTFGVATYAEPEPSAGGEMAPYLSTRSVPAADRRKPLLALRSRNRRRGSANRIGGRDPRLREDHHGRQRGRSQGPHPAADH